MNEQRERQLIKESVAAGSLIGKSLVDRLGMPKGVKGVIKCGCGRARLKSVDCVCGIEKEKEDE